MDIKGIVLRRQRSKTIVEIKVSYTKETTTIVPLFIVDLKRDDYRVLSESEINEAVQAKLDKLHQS